MPDKPWSIASWAGPRFGLLITLIVLNGGLVVVFVLSAVDTGRTTSIVLAAGWGAILTYYLVTLVRVLRYRRRHGGTTVPPG